MKVGNSPKNNYSFPHFSKANFKTNLLIETIKKRSDFLAIGKKNTCYYSKSTLILAAKTSEFYLKDREEDFVRIGYTITKKTGNAVVRNKCKRRYREIFRKLAPKLAQKHFDYVILARKEILNCEFAQLESDVKFCLKGINKLLNDRK